MWKSYKNTVNCNRLLSLWLWEPVIPITLQIFFSLYFRCVKWNFSIFITCSDTKNCTVWNFNVFLSLAFTLLFLTIWFWSNCDNKITKIPYFASVSAELWDIESVECCFSYLLWLYMNDKTINWQVSSVHIISGQPSVHVRHVFDTVKINKRTKWKKSEEKKLHGDWLGFMVYVCVCITITSPDGLTVTYVHE